MGLDAYAYKVPILKDIKEELDIEFLKETGLVETERVLFFEWRKQYPLQNFMEKLYRERGGKEQFNCIPVYLKEKDIKRLEKEGGYLKFVKDAMEALNEGYEIYYDSWW